MSINVQHHEDGSHRLDRESTTDLLQSRLEKLERWVEEHDYEGYEPFDGLSSYLRAFTFRNGFMERLLIQLVRQSPVNLRPLLGVKPHASTKGRGYMAWGYLKKYGFTGEERYKIRAERSLEWLMENRSPNLREYGWGNHFDFSSRGGRLPKHEPTIVWNSLIGQAFLDGYELLQERKYLEVAESVCRWILKLPREITSSGSCLSYVAYQQNSVHNSNMLGAALLARTARFTGDRKGSKVAKEAMEFSCSRQRGDGAWPYGVHPNTHWIDNFHTGYNLDSLRSYMENTGDPDYAENLRCGYEYFRRNFFEESGRPKYYHNRAYPIDIQCAAQAIDTLTGFSAGDEASLELAVRVARWTIDNMQDDSGYFYYRILPRMKVTAPMMHWGQATMYKALVQLTGALRR